jgi:mannosyl-oligosaccharide alpha-1,2-mannosidase
MYKKSLVAMKRNIFFRPMVPNNEDILFAGSVDSDGHTPVDKLTTQPRAQHLGCFAGGMVALAAKVFESPADLETARKLVEGCLWGYEHLPLGIMPEIMQTVGCDKTESCTWDEARWKAAVDISYEGPESVEEKISRNHLPPGVTKVDDARYILR